jgi:protease II
MYWEPAKYVARLRTLKTDNNPLLLVTNMAAGTAARPAATTPCAKPPSTTPLFSANWG